MNRVLVSGVFVGVLSSSCIGDGSLQDALDDAGDGGGSNLRWQDPPSESTLPWNDAVAYCNDLDLGGHDDWRLPTIDELRTIVEDCDNVAAGGACEVTESCAVNDCHDERLCTCADDGDQSCRLDSSLSGPCECYYSATDVPDGNDGDYHWQLCFDGARLNSSPATTPFYARCVR